MYASLLKKHFYQAAKAKNQSTGIAAQYFHIEKYNRKHTGLEQQDQC